MLPPSRHHGKEDNIDSWLMSYADMITLLLCFFIIFVSVSEPKSDKFRAVTNGLAQQFGSVDLSTPLQGVMTALQAVVEGHQMLRDVAIGKTDRSVEIELSSGAFFKPASVEFNEAQMPALIDLTKALQQADFLDYSVVIESHTSDEPPKSAMFASNWELSSARAGRMAQFLIDHGIKSERMKAVGFGATKPKVPNLDRDGHPIPENRQQNDRIVIRLERAM